MTHKLTKKVVSSHIFYRPSRRTRIPKSSQRSQVPLPEHRGYSFHLRSVAALESGVVAVGVLREVGGCGGGGLEGLLIRYLVPLRVIRRTPLQRVLTPREHQCLLQYLNSPIRLQVNRYTLFALIGASTRISLVFAQGSGDLK